MPRYEGGRGPGGPGDYMRQRYPGLQAQGHGPASDLTPDPSSALAAALVQLLRDGAAREEVELVLEEAFRNFYLHAAPPAWLEPPFSAIVSGGGILFSVVEAVLGTTSGWTDLCTYPIPDGNVGVLRRLGQGISALDGWNDVTWRLVRRPYGSSAGAGAELPISPYTTWKHQIGQVDLPADVYAVVMGPCTVALQANNTSASTAYTVYGRLDGWTFPPKAPGELKLGAMVAD